MPTVKQLIEQDRQPADLAQRIWDQVKIRPAQLDSVHVLLSAHRNAQAAFTHVDNVAAGKIHDDLHHAQDAADVAEFDLANATDAFLKLCSSLEVQL